jgi:hypothetical protein
MIPKALVVIVALLFLFLLAMFHVLASFLHGDVSIF